MLDEDGVLLEEASPSHEHNAESTSPTWSLSTEERRR
jgi:hypothetical protein